MRLPAGVRDWLPHELVRKREIEQTMRALFGRWAYSEVATPSFERFDVLEIGLGRELTKESFRFADRRATALALRPEMTTPIARLVSTRMREAPLPLRLSYVATAYRYYEQPQEGKMREFTQAGVELIGPGGVDADAEALFMAIEAMDEVGLRDANFDINIVALRAYERPELVSFAMSRGGREVTARARTVCRTPASLAALDRIDALLERAEKLGHASRVSVDLALLRDLEYYTGFLFEGYVPEVGFSLCGGGRYDSLLPRFGYDVAAVGWTAEIERLLIALERRGRHVDRKRPRMDVLVMGSDVIAARERAAGNVVRFAGATLSDEELLADAREHGIPRIVIATDGSLRELHVESYPSERLPRPVLSRKGEGS